MTIRDSSQADLAERQVEELLAQAAAFEPDEPAPADLVQRALGRLESDEPARRRRGMPARTALFGGLFLGAGACCASLVLAFGLPRTAPQIAPRPAAGSAGPLQAVVPAPEEPLETPRQPVLPVARAEPAATVRPRPGRRYAHLRRHRSPSAAAPARVARARWVDQRLDHEVSGVMAAGWLAEPADDGGVLLTPAVINIPATPAPGAGASPSDPVPNHTAPDAGAARQE